MDLIIRFGTRCTLIQQFLLTFFTMHKCILINMLNALTAILVSFKAKRKSFLFFGLDTGLDYARLGLIGYKRRSRSG